ncbi:MANEA-like protein [Mya arenaria]|uniref:MANEA-like protein n=1 Tax=Mya arenaria TaxID=6604 RepID=A0ABY7EBG3_MYAAR|nr:MANEA-like protein [Mya arenaria]
MTSCVTVLSMSFCVASMFSAAIWPCGPSPCPEGCCCWEPPGFPLEANTRSTADWAPLPAAISEGLVGSATKSSRGCMISLEKTSFFCHSNTIVEQEGEDKSVANCIEMDIDNTIEPNQNVHTFYYPWYGNPGHDGRYLHWNHVQISHWDKNEARKWPQGQHEPPDDVGSNFYPQLGPYSSSDPGTISCHMRMMRYAGIENSGVLAVSWYPPGDGDQNGLDPDTLLPLLLDTAYTHGLKVALHVEPFKGRDHLTMKSQLRYIMEKYGPHPAFYRTSVGDKLNLPLLYIYDSYLTSADKWAEIMKPGGRETVRGTELDAIFIGLLVERTHQNEILKAGFDGFYTYFASNGFVYGSTWNNWPLMSKWAKSNRLLFIPSVGPGYVDTEVRPWNQRNTKLRLDGKYYRQSVENALSTGSTFVSITSFNEWHEGSQIEPAVKKLTPSRKYEDYGVKGPLFYLDLTKEWVQSGNVKEVIFGTINATDSTLVEDCKNGEDKRRNDTDTAYEHEPKRDAKVASVEIQSCVFIDDPRYSDWSIYVFTGAEIGDARDVEADVRPTEERKEEGRVDGGVHLQDDGQNQQTYCRLLTI